MDLVVIGGGTSGYMVALGALQLGLKVAVIEKEDKLGGSSLYSGCIPSKALLHVASVARTIKTANEVGLEGYDLPANFKLVKEYIKEVVSHVKKEYTPDKFIEAGGKLYTGCVPRFIDPYTIGFNEEELQAKKFVIATGSRALIPNIKGLDRIGFLTNSTIFEINKVPERLVILGSKPSAIEFAQSFARLGSKVFVIEGGEHILSNEDPELVWSLREVLENEGITFFTNTIIHEVYIQNNRKVLACEDLEGEKFTIYGDEILISSGRKANVEGLGLENAGVDYLEEGINVDKRLRTSQKHIYAVGDVVYGVTKSTHAAEYQANVVLSNAVFHIPQKIKESEFPYVIFSDPEYAHVGLTEQQALENGYLDLEILRFKFEDLDSAITKRCTTGAIKVVARNGTIIGATILGAQASNLIAEWSLAIKLGATIKDISTTIHPYPTLAQINRRVASNYLSQKVFTSKSKKIVNWMQRVFA